MKLRFAIVAFLGLLGVWTPARADQPSSGSNAAVFDSACASFRRALDLSVKDPKASGAAAVEAAAGFRGLAESGGVCNHRLEVNLGNAWLLAGDLGRAVLAYRRAREITPDDPRVRSGLSALRARVGITIEPDTQHRLAAELLSWRAYLSRSTMFAVFLGTYVAGWGVALLRLTGRGGRWGGLGAVLGFFALVSFGLLALDDQARAHSRDAVVIAPTVVGRSGPGEAVYEASFKDPLRAGVECRVLESRGSWALVRLADGRETWLASSALEMVNGR